MKLDLKTTPFSSFGSYSAIQLGKLKEKQNDNNLYFRDVGGGDNDLGYIFKITIDEDNEYEISANEYELRVEMLNSNKFLSIFFPDENRVRFYSNGLSFSFDFFLNSYDHINTLATNKWELHNYSQEMKLLITSLEGNVKSILDWQKIKSTKAIFSFTGEKIDIDIQRYQCVGKKMDIKLSFFEELEIAKASFENYKKKLLKNSDNKYCKAKDLVSYITYSLFVHPLGNLPNYAMYMSKNWMTNIWSWDNCFNALGLCQSFEKLALDQLLIFSSRQDESGILPDTMNNLYSSYSCCKPPIEGWTYLLMMELNDYYKEEEPLREIYKQLIGLEKYWREYRIYDNYPIPYYNHGNDSGWDNATNFAQGMPVSSPDLPTYLVLLYQALSKIANLLGMKEKEHEYKILEESMVEKLIDNLWDGESFRSYNHLSKSFTTTGDSLIQLIPILIANRLPKEISNKVIEKLTSPVFISEHGIATEAINSPFYEECGYWRGPIWAPTTLLFVDALKKVGKLELSKKIANAFCENAEKFGMCENFDPISGKGWDDPSFAWTSNVFLLLANHYI